MGNWDVKEVHKKSFRNDTFNKIFVDNKYNGGIIHLVMANEES